MAPIAWLTWAAGLGLFCRLVPAWLGETRIREMGSEPSDAIVIIASALLVGQAPLPVPAVASQALLGVLGAAAMWVNLRLVLFFGASSRIDGSFVLPLATTPLAIAVLAAQQGLSGFALTAAAVAAATWIAVLVGLLIQRLRRGAMPPRLVPRLAILLSPPALIWRVWLTTGNPATLGGIALVVLGAFAAGLLVVHARTFAASVGTPESLSLTFPVANAATAVVLWVDLAQVPGWQAIAWAAVALSSVLTSAIVALHAHHAGGRTRRSVQHTTDARVIGRRGRQSRAVMRTLFRCC